MAPSTSRLAYEDHYKLLDRALASPEGIRAKYPDYGDSCRARLELYYARKVDRIENKSSFDKDHPMWGKSVYDPLRCTVEILTDKDSPCWLYIKPMVHGGVEVEELGEVAT